MGKRLTQQEAETKIKIRCTEINYTYLEFEYINWQTKIPVQCPVPEHGVSHIRYHNFIGSGVGCIKCSRENQGRTTLDGATVLKNVTDKCREKNFSFQPFTYTTSPSTYITVTCEQNHTWDVSYHKLVNGNRGCSKCAGNFRYTQHEANQMILEACEKKNYYFEHFTYINNQTEIIVKCPNPTHKEWKTTFVSLKSGSGCPSCNTGGYNPSLPGYFYINEIVLNNELYYKFGISNNIKGRMQDYKSNVLDSTMKKLFFSDDGKLIKEIESSIKKNSDIQRRAVPRKLFKDGFSETIAEKDYEVILRIIGNYSLEQLPVL